jgi:hypothetical protein
MGQDTNHSGQEWHFRVGNCYPVPDGSGTEPFPSQHCENCRISVLGTNPPTSHQLLDQEADS